MSGVNWSNKFSKLFGETERDDIFDCLNDLDLEFLDCEYNYWNAAIATIGYLIELSEKGKTVTEIDLGCANIKFYSMNPEEDFKLVKAYLKVKETDEKLEQLEG